MTWKDKRDDYQPDVPPMSLKPFNPGKAGEIKATASAADLLSMAAQCEAIGFDWLGLSSAYLDWKKHKDIGEFRWRANTAGGPVSGVDRAPDTLIYKGQEFRPELIPSVVTILPHAIRDGSLQKFTDLLVTKEIFRVECIAPDAMSYRRVLRCHAPGKIFTLKEDKPEDKKEVANGSGPEAPTV
ncbi:hypothetical protein [Deinococcus cellulosilyticus]|uniref:Uncharacterized protein n=1 Tax=Deinococcus cellulosilyticus (strain DSM 18568 / NBRC 106333 / KACC 11606 / 5516J-15) TaxID=1223518 RepID=A0A511MW47_DEIC1|nr:hypothetical protein [Deinococcus cellulosilyticus]GEM44799.1 hypothetical protein DC3_04340 [Deinococcus cellulosilyticus NBRC 106333 = KACC 11606]